MNGSSTSSLKVTVNGKKYHITGIQRETSCKALLCAIAKVTSKDEFLSRPITPSSSTEQSKPNENLLERFKGDRELAGDLKSLDVFNSLSRDAKIIVKETSTVHKERVTTTTTEDSTAQQQQQTSSRKKHKKHKANKEGITSKTFSKNTNNDLQKEDVIEKKSKQKTKKQTKDRQTSATAKSEQFVIETKHSTNVSTTTKSSTTLKKHKSKKHRSVDDSDIESYKRTSVRSKTTRRRTYYDDSDVDVYKTLERLVVDQTKKLHRIQIHTREVKKKAWMKDTNRNSQIYFIDDVASIDANSKKEETQCIEQQDPCLFEKDDGNDSGLPSPEYDSSESQEHQQRPIKLTDTKSRDLLLHNNVSNHCNNETDSTFTIEHAKNTQLQEVADNNKNFEQSQITKTTKDHIINQTHTKDSEIAAIANKNTDVNHHQDKSQLEGEVTSSCSYSTNSDDVKQISNITKGNSDDLISNEHNTFIVSSNQKEIEATTTIDQVVQLNNTSAEQQVVKESKEILFKTTLFRINDKTCADVHVSESVNTLSTHESPHHQYQHQTHLEITLKEEKINQDSFLSSNSYNEDDLHNNNNTMKLDKNRNMLSDSTCDLQVSKMVAFNDALFKSSISATNLINASKKQEKKKLKKSDISDPVLLSPATFKKHQSLKKVQSLLGKQAGDVLKKDILKSLKATDSTTASSDSDNKEDKEKYYNKKLKEIRRSKKDKKDKSSKSKSKKEDTEYLPKFQFENTDSTPNESETKADENDSYLIPISDDSEERLIKTNQPISNNDLTNKGTVTNDYITAPREEVIGNDQVTTTETTAETTQPSAATTVDMIEKPCKQTVLTADEIFNEILEYERNIKSELDEILQCEEIKEQDNKSEEQKKSIIFIKNTSGEKETSSKIENDSSLNCEKGASTYKNRQHQLQQKQKDITTLNTTLQEDRKINKQEKDFKENPVSTSNNTISTKPRPSQLSVFERKHDSNNNIEKQTYISKSEPVKAQQSLATTEDIVHANLDENDSQRMALITEYFREKKALDELSEKLFEYNYALTKLSEELDILNSENNNSKSAKELDHEEQKIYNEIENVRSMLRSVTDLTTYQRKEITENLEMLDTIDLEIRTRKANYENLRNGTWKTNSQSAPRSLIKNAKVKRRNLKKPSSFV